MQTVHHDVLTNLPDNRALIQKLKSLGKVNYFLLNIDNFSNINNAYGYDIGDKILSEVAKFLNMFKPVSSQMYRFCSDRFVLVDESALSESEVRATCESILSFFTQTEISVDEIDIMISFTIGVSQANGLINITQSEWAMKEARDLTRNNYHIFDASSYFIYKEQQNLYWMQKVKEAVDSENIVAFYQPIRNNHTKKIEKYECLARIRDDDEDVSPALFMESAKLIGGTSYITKAIIMQSFKKFAGTEYEFSINITSEDLNLEYLEEFLLKYVNKYNINPTRVVLEMLEDISSLGGSKTLEQLNSLRMNGFQVAIDDFGAENSNFTRLLEIAPDYIKIDGAFIKHILTDETSQVIVDAIIMVCRARNIKIIAEYIHNEKVQEKVEELGIDYSQGYYFGEPRKELVE